MEYERFTDPANQIMELAVREAEVEGSKVVRQTHLLLGMIGVTETTASTVLEKHDITRDRLRGVMSGLPVRSDDIEGIPGEGLLSAGTQRVMDLSIREALELGHNYIGPAHLLLGVLRQAEGPGVIALGRLDVDVLELRQEIVSLVRGDEAAEDERPPSDTRLLTAFLYVLMRDHVPLGVVEEIMQDHIEALKRRGIETHSFSNVGLAQYAGEVADRLLD